MTWPARTWVDGELMTAALGNNYWRDPLADVRAGGLAISSQAANDFLYASGASQLTRLTGAAGVPTFTSGAWTMNQSIPIGQGWIWFTDTAPTGWLLCDGTNVVRATYGALNFLWGTAGYPYGAGNGTTTFTLPDFRQRIPMGKAASGTGNALAGTGGTIDHTHTGPSHTHAVDPPSTGSVGPSALIQLDVGTGSGVTTGSSSHTHNLDIASVTSGSGGTGVTGTNNPPYLVVNYIVKY